MPDDPTKAPSLGLGRAPPTPPQRDSLEKKSPNINYPNVALTRRSAPLGLGFLGVFSLASVAEHLYLENRTFMLAASCFKREAQT